MSWQTRNPGGARSAIIAVDRSLFAAKLRKPPVRRLRFSAARLPDWMRFDWRDVGLALTLTLALAVMTISGSYRLLRERSMLEMADFVGLVFLDGLLIWFPMVAALKAAERLSFQGWRRHLTTIAIATTVTIAIDAPAYFGSLWNPGGLKYGIAASPIAFLLFAIWQNTAIALIARAWLVKSREESNASKLLARMRSEQVSVRRRLVEGRLKAIQARVDPLFFFAMLDAVQKTYTVNVTRAEQLLDELTAFLRAALPRLRTASSTVEQECDLACSFARLRGLAGLGAAQIDVDNAPSIGGAHFPPGVLMPLLNELLRATADAGTVGISFATDSAATTADGSAATASRGAQDESARSSVMMQLTAQTKPSIEVITETRATLYDLFGANADLTSAAIDGGVQTTVRVPYEPASA